MGERGSLRRSGLSIDHEDEELRTPLGVRCSASTASKNVAVPCVESKNRQFLNEHGTRKGVRNFKPTGVL
jgi:hypothetical protein